MQYRLRTLLIVLALGPPVLAVCFWMWTEWLASPKIEVEFSFSQRDLIYWPRKPPELEVPKDDQTVQP